MRHLILALLLTVATQGADMSGHYAAHNVMEVGATLVMTRFGADHPLRYEKQ
jgi:hypothetical protein